MNVVILVFRQLQCLFIGWRMYVDIMTRGKLSSIYVAIYPVIYWSVRLFSRRGTRMRMIVILARYKFYFIKEHENLVQDISAE